MIWNCHLPQYIVHASVGGGAVGLHDDSLPLFSSMKVDLAGVDKGRSLHLD